MKSTLRRLTRRRRPARQQPPRGQFLEQLEARQMMDANDIISVGRTLSAWTTADITGNELKIKYSVFNQQEEAVDGVSLTTTLQPGVSFVNASIAPVQTGQQLTWNLGDLAALGRTTVEVVVTFPGAVPLQLDSGASATGTVDAVAVNDSANPALLRTGAINASLLTATPDANSDDPYIQAAAAMYDQDPAQIFQFVKDTIGYESYTGSLRGSRGTLWSEAGNSLDQASLMIAMLRASGVPSQYVSGTLSDPFAKDLILSMFSEPQRITGLIPAGATVGDPANDPQLLAETRSHFWVQLDTGSGMTDADPAFAGASLGDAFATADDSFAEVPDAMRHKVRVQLDREFANTAMGLFGLNPLSTATVLNVTFNAVDLVGKPLSIGHFVDTHTVGSPVFTSITNTYSPYIAEGDFGRSDSNDHLIRGTDYQEVITNFPFGSQVLTGLFLKIELSGPDGPSEVHERTLVDLIGYDVRTNGGTPDLNFDPSAPSTLTPYDIFTLNITPSKFEPNAIFSYAAQIASLQEQLEELSPGGEIQLGGPAATLAQQLLIAQSRMSGAQVLYYSDLFTQQTADFAVLRAYFDRPRIVMTTNRLTLSGDDNSTATFSSTVDLRRDTIRAVVPPGQNVAAAAAFQFSRGIVQSIIETEVTAERTADVPDADPIISTSRIFSAARAAGIGLMTISAENISELDATTFSAEAKARISAAIATGNAVIVPERPVEIDGVERIAWYEVNLISGESIGVTEDGGHQAISEYTAYVTYSAIGAGVLYGMIGYINFITDPSNGPDLKDRKEKLRNGLGIEIVGNGVATALGAPVPGLGPFASTIFGWTELLFRALVVNINGQDPPLPEQFISPPPLDDFNDLSGTGVATKTVLDPFFTLPHGGAQLPTVFRVGIKNEQAIDDRFTIEVLNVPSGWEAITTVPEIGVSAGETAEVGLVLRPTGILPPPGTSLSFDVKVTSVNDSGVMNVFTREFTVPAVPGVEVSLESPPGATTPGVPVVVALSVKGVGNVPADVTFDVALPDGLTLDGLTSVTINPGDTIVQTLTLTPQPGLPLNSVFSAVITVHFGGIEPQSIVIPFRLVVPGTDAIAKAAVVASQLGNPELARRLNDLSIALTNLTQDPTDVYKSQAVASLNSVISQLEVDPILSKFATDLTNARNELLSADTPLEIQSAILNIGNALDNFAEIIDSLIASDFNVSIANNSQVAQPGVPQTFQVVVQNIGTETSTYNFAAAGLPAGVSSQFDNPSVTIDPGQFATVTLTLTQDNPEELAAFNFQVDVSIDGVTPAITKSVNGSLTVRNEFVKVVDVQTDVSFTNPGGVVAVSTRLLNAVNRRQNALLSYEVFNANGDSVFTSSAVAAQLTVQTTLADVDLGSFNTTGYALGNYRIVVTVTDEFGAPIPGATGEALLLVGTPVKATLDVSQNDLLPGTRTITNTLQIDSSTPLGDAFDLIGQATSAGSTNAIRHGDFVYVATPNGLQVFDISGANINNPQLVRTIGQAVFTLKIHNDMLVTASAGNSSRVDIYSLTDPSDPQLLGSTGVLPYGSASSMVITDTHVYVVMINVIYWLGSNDVFDMNGSVVAINIEDPTMPYLDGDAITAQGTAAGRDGVNDGVLFNDNGTNTDGFKSIGGVDQSGGNHNTWDIKQVSPTIVLVTGSSATGTDTQTGVGQVYVVDISDPSNMFVVRTLDIPGTVHAFGLAIDGDVALLTATEGGLQDFAAGTPFTGRVVLATLDISDPENPSIINTKILDDLARGVTFPAALGNGLFAMGTDGTGDGSKIYLIDATDPANLFLGVNDAPAVRPTAADGGNNLILTTDGSSLIIYQAQATPAIPVTAQVQVPTGTGVTIVPGSFNIPPTQIIAGVGFDTLVWDLALTAGNDSITITWETTVTDIKPAESRDVTLDTTIDFEENGTPGQIVLPPQTVAARHIIEIVPDEQTVQPGQTVIYGVSLSNPTNASVTYDLAVAGIPQEWVNLVSEVTLPAFGFVNVPLFVSPDIFAVLGDYGFVVTATAAGGTDSVQGVLTVEGDPIVPPADPLAHGVVVELTPIGVAAGQGTAAHYVVRLTNTGSEAENYNLSLSGLPAGFTVAFAQSSIVVPPGASNFREIALTIMVPNGATTGDHVFNIDVFSTDSGASDEVFGLVNVSAIGVDVEFMPNSGSPGSVFDLKVTNNSTTTQTFNLSLAGPAALVASLGVNSVTLGPGAFQMVSINVGVLDYAYPGAIDLVAVARSQTNTAVQDSDLASVNITGRLAMTAAFDDDSIQLNQPGTTSFTLLVENLGNLEDQYVAEIISTTGPVSASLIGLDGKPTQSIPLFLLPGLSTGAIVLNANLNSLLPGTITVRIRSLTDNTIVAQDTARIIVPIPDDIGDIIALGSVGGSDVRTRVKVVDPTNDAVIVTFTPYGNSFHGGVRVATADLDKDGVLEIITAPGPGRDPLVKVFDLAGNELLEYRITAYSKSFTGGVYVAVGDIDGDGYLDIITTPGGDMAAEVRVWRNRLNKGDRYEHDVFSSGPYRNFLAFGSTFHGGATVAADDLNGDGRAEVVVGNGPGMAPRIRAFDLRKFKQTATPQLGKHSLEFRPFESTDRGGVFVAAANIRGSVVQIIVGNGVNGRGEVEIYRANGTLQHEFVPYPSGDLNAPVHVSRKNYDGGRLFEILTSQGSPGSSKSWNVWEYDGDLVDEALEEDLDFRHGFFVA